MDSRRAGSTQAIPAQTASEAARQILQRPRSASQRLATYGDIHKSQAHTRWWLRRGMLGLLLVIVAYPTHYSLIRSANRHGVITVAPHVAETIDLLAIPLLTVRAICSPADWCCAQLDTVCDRLVLASIGRRPLFDGINSWFLLGLAVLLIPLYGLSPGPVWWGFRLCAIELMACVYAVMELIYAPLIWAVDRSRTAREFYEAYYDVMEWID